MNKSVLLILVNLLILFCTVSCKEKKYPPQLTAVSPTAAPIGADITLSGSQFGEDPAVTIAGQTVPTKTRADNAITLTLPRLPIGPTTIRVQNADGTSSPLPFTVLQPLPQLSSVEPANGLPATTVRIRGDYLDQLKAVRFGNTTAELVGTGSATEISVKVPSLGRGPVPISVETAGGTSQANFIVAATPELTGFSPKRAIVGQEITLSGKNLLDGVVSLNGQPIDKTKTSVQDNQIRFSLPPTASSGRLTVTVFDKLSATTPDSLIIIPPPLIDATGLSLTEGIRGDKLTLTGRNLLDVTTVSFGGTPATGLRVLSNTQLELTVPERSQSGETPLTVTSPGGTTEAPQKFLMLLAPAELTADPDRQGRGKDITVRGRNLHRITQASLNGKAATITGRTEGSELKLTVPADATTGRLILTNRAGSGTSGRNLTVVLKPVLTELSPTRAPVGGLVTIRGNYLLGARVFFATDQTPTAVALEKNDDDEISFRVPAFAKDGAIRVWNNESGEYTDTPVFNVILSPGVTSVASEYNNNEGFVGEKVILSGQNFDECAVRFEGSSQNAENVETPTRVRLAVRIPPDARTGKIRVFNTRYSTESPSEFQIIGKPNITDINPNRARAGQSLIIKGTSLKRIDDVKIGGQAVAKSAFSENAEGTQLTVTVPDAALRGRIYAHNKAGSDEHSGENFTIVRKPRIDDFSPRRQVVGGLVTIRGDYLYGARVSFGGREATEYPKLNFDDEIIAKVPDGASDGAIRVTNLVDAEQRDGFSVVRAPVISGFSPANGSRGAEVTITGQYLDAVTEVRFSGGGSTPAQILDKNSGSLRVRVPENAVTGTICVNGDAGQRCSGNAFTVNLILPTIDKSRCVPTGVIPGSALTLRGTNFGTVSQVRFTSGTVARDQFIRIAADEITLKVPANTQSGLVQLVNENGAGPGVQFDVVAGGDGLNAGNISTGTTNLTGINFLSRLCNPWVYQRFNITHAPTLGTTSRTFFQFLYENCNAGVSGCTTKDCSDNQRSYDQKETIGQRSYRVFGTVYYASAASACDPAFYDTFKNFYPNNNDPNFKYRFCDGFPGYEYTLKFELSSSSGPLKEGKNTDLYTGLVIMEVRRFGNLNPESVLMGSRARDGVFYLTDVANTSRKAQIRLCPEN
ncbi:IPT/TIG domain-containing protein [Spirosoma sordidisoli]|uniref:IPT/TIG domain-containing protein n=1 Tax=Spirosoma sordidisoli TaxID=2502893 RepID=A0A4Q2UEZ8_9BACT|nr:IPT/TIG domain-containing protein [Spirosoma sordidisoli]RYC66902.1 hypothetical protein EQG79_27765 [Spirosoma sordidisoli]